MASEDSPYNIRTLALTTEVKLFLGVTTALSVAYLWSFSAKSRIDKAEGIKVTPVKMEVGLKTDLALTLISADAYKLSCASDMVTKFGRCAYTAAGEAYKPKDGEAPLNADNTLVPYMTVDNVLLVIPGLWTQPLLKKRLDDEPPGKVSQDDMELRRFTTTCKVEIVDTLKEFKVRWIAQGPFAEPQSQGAKVDTALIGRVSECKMTGG